MKRDNVLLIWDRMGDYHRARLDALQKEMQSVKVLSADLGATDKLYGWGTKEHSLHFQLSSKPSDRFDIKRLYRFIKILRAQQVGALCIAGYGKPEYIFFLLYGKLTRRKVVMFAESWYPSSSFIDKAKSVFLNFCCDGFLVSGIRARDHFARRLNINRERIKMGYSVVDNDHFSSASGAKDDVTNPELLSVARFASEKNLELMMNAFNQSSLPARGWVLTIIGGGPLKDRLEMIKSKNIKLLPWQSYEELPDFYRNAAVFILPSLFEPWGLVVNEAMAAGLPIILSKETGCLPDFLEEDINGWSFSANEETELIGLFNRVGQLPNSPLQAMGEVSKDKVREYSLGLFATNLKALLLT